VQWDKCLCFSWKHTAGIKFEDFQDQMPADGGASDDQAPNNHRPAPQRNHNGPIHGEKHQFWAVQRYLEKVRSEAKKTGGSLSPRSNAVLLCLLNCGPGTPFRPVYGKLAWCFGVDLTICMHCATYESDWNWIDTSPVDPGGRVARQ
jgi:hypothetical protein